MNIAILTNEYPPNVYGGAGVHVEYLTRELAKLDDGAHRIHVFCFGEQRVQQGNLTVHGVEAGVDIPAQDPRHTRFLDTMARDLQMAGRVAEADVVHCHTWYSHFAGCLVKQLAGSKLVLTTHSLEPHRPWKVEQLGTAYHASSWIEKTAYQNADGVVAVSRAMRQDVHDLYGVPFERIQIIPNGIDPDEYRPTPAPEVLRQYDIDPETPYVLFVGRITRQKGILHLVRAIRHLEPGVQVVLAAGAPDTEEIAREMTALVEEARAEGQHRIVWIPKMMPREHIIPLYSHAAVFVCPSVYEPFGIINLEAMACETPVVASAVGGIPEIVVPGETGLLVELEARGATDFEPKDPERFSRDLATAVNRLLGDAALRERMGTAARRRVLERFSWASVARQTLAFYQRLVAG
ncbi:glycosyl transferase family 1 [Rhodothermaceae bacterium RA]|nr:glycosyl transferase family 1 [Rhodothermaceae bacterium RA]